MNITLHDSIPAARRPEVEALVRKLAGECRISWMPSRFPRFVMLVEPGGTAASGIGDGSFFESPRVGGTSIAEMTEILEDRIKACLATGHAR